jgi:hypothetical protein
MYYGKTPGDIEDRCYKCINEEFKRVYGLTGKGKNNGREKP